MRLFSLTGKKQRFVFAALLAGMPVFLTACFPAGPDSGTSAKKELAELQRRIEDAEKIIGQASSIMDDLNRSVSGLKALMVHAPQVDRYAWAYEYVTHCAANSQVTIDYFEEVVPDSAGGTDGAGSAYEIRITTRCGYSHLVEFLRHLEKDCPLLRIKTVTIAAVQDDPMAHRVQIIVQWMTEFKIEKG